MALDSPLPVTTGNDVFAVVKLTTAGYTYPVAVDKNGPIETARTYISRTGASGTWSDLSPYDADATIRLRTSTPAPTVTSITPSLGENVGLVSITNLVGNDFQPGATVKLVKMGQTDIDATNVAVVDSTQITCDLDLSRAPPGLWDVVVTNPDAQSGTLPSGFTVYSSVSLDLSLGRNLISLSLEPLDPATEEVLSSIAGDYDQILAYDGCDLVDPWTQYIPGDGGNDLTTMDVQRGYWVHTTSPTVLTVAGTLPAVVEIPLCTGWNLAGYPAQTASPRAEALASITGCYTQVQTWDTTEPGNPWKQFDASLPAYANDLVMMQPGRGHWISVSVPCMLSVLP